MENIKPQDLKNFIENVSVDGQLDDDGIKQVMNYLITSGTFTGSPRDLMLIRRGLQSNLPKLMNGELAFTTDTNELYVGTSNGNVNVTKGSKLSTFDVSKYGAKGDGFTDDTEAFKKMFLDVHNTVGYKFINIPTGTYIISQAIETSINNTVINGEGSCIKAINNINASVMNLFLFGHSANVTIQNMVFDGNCDNQSGEKNTYLLHFMYGHDLKLTNCTFKNGYGDMVVFRNNTRTTVDNCLFDKTVSSPSRDFMGLLFIGEESDRMNLYATATNNTFKNITFDALVFSGQFVYGLVAHHAVISNNTFIDCGHMKHDSISAEQDAASIYIQWASDVIIDGNLVDGTYGNGIDLLNGGNTIISNNMVYRSGNAGISIEGSDEVTIVGNMIRDNVTKGRTPLNVEHGLLAGVTIKSPFANVNISSNVITDTHRTHSAKTQLYAIYLRGNQLSNINIKGNNLSENKESNPIFWEHLNESTLIEGNVGYNPRRFDVFVPTLPSIGEARNINPFPVMVYLQGGVNPKIRKSDSLTAVSLHDAKTIYLAPMDFISFDNAPDSWQWYGL